MRTYSRSRIVAVAVVCLVGAGTAATSLNSQATGPQVVIAEFTDVSPVEPGMQVKVNGVTVGEIGEPMLDHDRKLAMVPLEVDASALPLHTDASAQVAPISLLGERYIKLDKGSASAPELPRGAHITAAHTGRTVELQDVVDTLDDPTASSLAALLVTLGKASNQNGLNFQRTMRALAPAMTDTNKLVSVLAEQNQLLGSVIDRVEPVTSAFAAGRGQKLDRLVNSARTLLNATAARDAQLRSTLDQLPSTLAESQRTLAKLTNTSTSAADTLARLRPTTDNLAAMSAEMSRFADAANPALASANPVLDRANQLLDRARPIAQELRRVAPNLSGTARGARPIVTKLNQNMANVLDFIRYWALTTNGRDGLSHYFRAGAVISDQTVTGLIPGGGPNDAGDPGTQAKPRPRIDDPRQTGNRNTGDLGDLGNLGNLGDLGDLGSLGDLGQSGGMPGGLLQGGAAPDGGATGLSAQQEQGALGLLLGGL